MRSLVEAELMTKDNQHAEARKLAIAGQKQIFDAARGRMMVQLKDSDEETRMSLELLIFVGAQHTHTLSRLASCELAFCQRRDRIGFASSSHGFCQKDVLRLTLAVLSTANACEKCL